MGEDEKKKQLDLVKGSGYGGGLVLVLGMLWNIQATIADGNGKLNQVINEIDKRVVALEVKQQREDIYNVQRLTK